VRVSDVVVSIGGTRVTELGLRGSLEALRGDEGSQVKIGVRRGDQGRVDTLDVVRTVFSY
jgi:C-terminal processing protease CtpA/Prc